MAYGTYLNFEQYLEGFATSYYGSMNDVVGTISIDFASIETDLTTSYNKLNTQLDSVERIPLVPVGTNPRTGQYNPYLIEWNCCDVIFNKLRSRHTIEYQGKLPDWMLSFATRCDNIIEDIWKGKITLDTDTTNKGIGIAQKVTTLGYATMITNWDSGFYSGSDYEKTFHFKITGTTGGNGFEQAEFSISEDNGYSYSSNKYKVGTGWINIQSGLLIRWIPPTSGTQTLFEYNDEWKVLCTPQNTRNITRRTISRRFGRG